MGYLTRWRRFVPLSAFMLAVGGACTSFSEGDEPTLSPDGQAPDGTADVAQATDATLGEAAPDATAPRYCETVDATDCWDFETPPYDQPPARLSTLASNAGNSSGIESGFESGHGWTNNLVVKDGGTGYPGLRTELLGTQSLRCELDIRLDTVTTMNTPLILQGNGGQAELTFTMPGMGGGFTFSAAIVPTPPETGSTTKSINILTAAPARWRHISLALDAMGLTAVLSNGLPGEDGTLNVSQVPTALVTGPYRALFVANCPSDCTDSIDNITCIAQ